MSNSKFINQNEISEIRVEINNALKNIKNNFLEKENFRRRFYFEHEEELKQYKQQKDLYLAHAKNIKFEVKELFNKAKLKNKKQLDDLEIDYKFELEEIKQTKKLSLEEITLTERKVLKEIDNQLTLLNIEKKTLEQQKRPNLYQETKALEDKIDRLYLKKEAAKRNYKANVIHKNALLHEQKVPFLERIKKMKQIKAELKAIKVNEINNIKTETINLKAEIKKLQNEVYPDYAKDLAKINESIKNLENKKEDFAIKFKNHYETEKVRLEKEYNESLNKLNTLYNEEKSKINNNYALKLEQLQKENSKEILKQRKEEFYLLHKNNKAKYKELKKVIKSLEKQYKEDTKQFIKLKNDEKKLNHKIIKDNENILKSQKHLLNEKLKNIEDMRNKIINEIIIVSKEQLNLEVNKKELINNYKNFKEKNNYEKLVPLFDNYDKLVIENNEIIAIYNCLVNEKELIYEDKRSVNRILIDQKVTKRLKNVNTAYFFIAPAVFGALVFTVLPLVFMLVGAFFSIDATNLGRSQFVGFTNFYDIFMFDTQFQKSLVNTLIYALITIGLLSIVTLSMAAWLNRSTKVHNAVQTMVFTPHIASLVAISILWIALLSPQGIINQFLKVFGIEGPLWLLQENTSLLSVSMVTVWKDIGYYVLLIIAGLQGIPAYVYEAAKLDKAKKSTTFFKITVPLLAPTLSFVFVNKFINSFKVFAPIEIMTNGGPMGSSTVLSYWIYKAGRIGFNYGQAMAGAIILTILITIFTVLNHKVFKREIQY